MYVAQLVECFPWKHETLGSILAIKERKTLEMRHSPLIPALGRLGVQGHPQFEVSKFEILEYRRLYLKERKKRYGFFPQCPGKTSTAEAGKHAASNQQVSDTERKAIYSRR